MGKRCYRNIWSKPDILFFKPAGVQKYNLEEVIVELDEYEALKLVDVEKLTMQEWAKKMEISSATFNRLVQSVHRKIANAIIYWKVIKINNKID